VGAWHDRAVNATPKPIGSPVGLHRVVSPAGVLPQAAQVLDTAPTLWPDEVKIAVERLNLDAASFRQLWNKHEGDGAAVRAEVLDLRRGRDPSGRWASLRYLARKKGS